MRSGSYPAARLDKRGIAIIFSCMSNAVEELVIRARDHYVTQFQTFIRRQRETCVTGAAEVKFELGADSSAYRGLAVVDFVRNDAGTEGILFEPDSFLTFDKIEGNIARTDLVIDGLRWDAISIHHDVLDVDQSISSWFEKWFDPDEINFDQSADTTNCIHAVYIEPNELQVDLGTAPAEAFWELLDSLVGGEASFVNVRAQASPTDD
jgi:hypothetical protein